jgi:hypothetical protein
MIEEGIENGDLEEARQGVEHYIEKLRTIKVEFPWSLIS